MELENRRVCIAGLGYTGLPTAAMLARRGSEVVGFDPHIKVLTHTLAGQPDIELMDADAVREAADLVEFLVAHRSFRSMKRNLFLNRMVFDVIGLMG